MNSHTLPANLEALQFKGKSAGDNALLGCMIFPEASLALQHEMKQSAFFIWQWDVGTAHVITFLPTTLRVSRNIRGWSLLGGKMGRVAMFMSQ
jgi:hypothetical protein